MRPLVPPACRAARPDRRPRRPDDRRLGGAGAAGGRPAVDRRLLPLRLRAPAAGAAGVRTSGAATGRGPAGQVRLAWIAGVFFAADLILWHHAISQVGAGLATVLGNTQVVVVPLGAWLFLRERPSGRVAISVPVVLVGVVLISGVIGSGAYGENPLLGVILGPGDGARVRRLHPRPARGERRRRRPAGPALRRDALGGGGHAAGRPAARRDRPRARPGRRTAGC